MSENQSGKMLKIMRNSWMEGIAGACNPGGQVEQREARRNRPSRVGLGWLSSTCALLLLLIFSSGPAQAARICVPSSFDGSCNSSQATIAAAITAATSSVDNVYVQAGTYSENISYGGKNITILSASGAATTKIQGAGGSNKAVVDFISGEGASAVLDGFTIDNQGSGAKYRGIKITTNSTPTIQNCVIVGNTLTTATYNADNYGGGIYIDTGGGATISSTTIGQSGLANAATYGSGIYANGGSTLAISNSTVSYNAGRDYAGIYLAAMTGTTTLSNTNVVYNDATTGYITGGIYANASSISITGGSISNNTGKLGAGLRLENVPTITTINNVAINSNNSGGNIAGGIYSINSPMTISNGTTVNNNVSRDGAGIYMTGSYSGFAPGTKTTIDSSTISGNNASGYPGGGILSSGSPLEITNSNITFNNGRQGAGLRLLSLPLVTIISNTNIDDNLSNSLNEGGGIYSSSSPLTITGGSISRNTGIRDGAGIYLTGNYSAFAPGTKTTINGATINNNDSGSYTGGGIYSNAIPVELTGVTVSNNGAATGAAIKLVNLTEIAVLDNVTVSNNTSTSGLSSGGAIVSSEAPMDIRNNSLISGNTAGRQGAALFITGAYAAFPLGTKTTITDSTVSNNISSQNYVGGGIYTTSAMDITRSHILGNRGGNGGGLYSSTTLSITNSVFAGNVADRGTNDGGALNVSASTTITNSTIAGNYASRYAGGMQGAATVVNSIFWGNTSGLAPAQVNGGPTITYSDVSGGYAGTGNINSDPLFVNLQQASAGNPTTAGNYHIQSGSPAENTGTSSGAPSGDIDGDSRPQGAGYDMGADEVAVAGSTTTLATGTDPGNSSIGPGGAATNAGAFSFQTSSGTDVITAATVTLAAGTSGGLSLVEITSADGATVYGSAANPASDTPAITLSTNTLTATTTLTEYRIRITPKSHANMPAPAGASYAVTAYISNWTGTNAHAGSDTGGTTVTIDNLSTANATAATATAGNTQVALAWTNPADADFHSTVVLRRAGSAVADVPVEGSTYVVGNTIGTATVACVIASPTATCTDTGLTNGTAYHYLIFAKDSNGNYSATGVVPTGSPATPGPRICVPSMFDASCNSSQTTLALAITAATSGVNDIYVQAGTYSENINYGGKNITILSASGAATTTIRGDNSNNPVVTFSTSETSAAVLDGFTIDNQNAGNTLTRGIYISGASPTIQNCIVQGNITTGGTTDGGGVYINNSAPTFTSVTIRANTAGRDGAGIYITGAAGGATISGSTIGGAASGDGNISSAGRGGGIYYTGSTTGTLSISNSSIQYNQANMNNGGGGGLFATTITNQISITNTTVWNNSAGNGSTTYADGGGIYIMTNTPLSFSGGSVSNNVARSGVGLLVFNGADLTITGGAVIDNNDTNYCTSGDGGAIYATSAGSTVTMTGGSITNNAGRYGSGVYVTSSAAVALTGVTITGNSSACASNDGGGIHANGGTLTADRSKVRGNRGRNGGGVYAWGGAVVTIRNSDVTGNVADTDGGGAMVSGATTLNIYNSTVAGNYAGGGSNGGGGVRNNSATLNITNGIVYGNTAAINAGISSSGTTTITYSSYQAMSGACTGCSNNRAVGENPLFVNLQQAGAGAPTTAGDFHIQVSSPVINQGANNGLTPDIDGDSRPLNGAYEMGSDETASLNVSGTLYSDEGATAITTGPTVRLIVNGASVGTAVANGSGVYSVSAAVNPGDAIIVYIDNDGSYKGNTVTVSDGANLSGLNIYADRVITRHDNSGSLTNALMGTALGAYSDTDILYSVSGGNLTANAANTELFVWTGHTFAPGGSVTTTHVDINGTLDAAANAINVAGNWDATGGVFTSTGTVTFNATSGTNTITPGGTDANHDFQNIVFNDGGGTATWQLQGHIDADGNITVTDGILDTKNGSNYNVTVGGNFTDTAAGRVLGQWQSLFTAGGNITFDLNNSTTERTDLGYANFMLTGGGTFTLNNLSEPWTYGIYKLTGGQSGNTTNIVSNTGFAIRNLLTVGTGEVTGTVGLYFLYNATFSFDAASNLSIDDIYIHGNDASTQNLPTLTNGYDSNITLSGPNTTVNMTGNVTLNAPHNLIINGQNQASRVGILNTNGFALTVGGNLQIGYSGDNVGKTLNATNSTVTVGGNLTYYDADNAVFTTTGSTVVLNGTGQSINGSITFNNLTKSVTTADTLTFQAGKTTTINGTVTLNGASGQLLTLASSSPGSAWNFNLGASSTKAISYVSVSWSNASGSDADKKPINPSNSTDGGNCTDWFAAIVYQPDTMIKLTSEGDGAYLTDNTYEATASVQVKSQGVVSGSTAAYVIKFQNDSASTDSLVITGTPTGSSFTVQYLDDTATDRTAAVTGAGYTISSLTAGASKVWTLNVTPGGSVAGNTSYNVYVTATSSGDSAKKDQVKATTSSTSAVLTLLKSADKGSAAPSEEISYSVTASNGAGLTAASSIVLTDAIPANTGFKVGGASFSAGTSTLTNALSYSNDNGSTWTYTPTSTGCSAPANYDYCVTHVKWTTSGSMPAGTNFSIGLVVVVK